MTIDWSDRLRAAASHLLEVWDTIGHIRECGCAACEASDDLAVALEYLRAASPEVKPPVSGISTTRPSRPRPADLMGAVHDRAHEEVGTCRPARVARPAEEKEGP